MILPEYLSTLFLLPESHIKEFKKWPRSFWIITACNPYSSGQRSKDSENNARLEKDLKAMCEWICPIICTSKDGGHDAEPSFAVSGLNFEQVQNAAKEYSQNAVFLIEDNVLTVVSCTEDRQCPAGYFEDKIISEENYNSSLIKI